MHALRVVTFYKVRRPAVADKEGFKFGVGNSRKDGRVVDFVAVEMEDGKNSSVCDWVQESAKSLREAYRSCFMRITYLLLCQLVANGPVSLSPSPTMVKAMRFG